MRCSLYFGVTSLSDHIEFPNSTPLVKTINQPDNVHDQTQPQKTIHVFVISFRHMTGQGSSLRPYKVHLKSQKSYWLIYIEGPIIIRNTNEGLTLSSRGLKSLFWSQKGPKQNTGFARADPFQRACQLQRAAQNQTPEFCAFFLVSHDPSTFWITPCTQNLSQISIPSSNPQPFTNAFPKFITKLTFNTCKRLRISRLNLNCRIN